MRMIRINIITTLTARKMVRAPQRSGESFEGTLGFAGASLGAAGFCPGTASSTPSSTGAFFCPSPAPPLIKGLINEGAVF